MRHTLTLLVLAASSAALAQAGGDVTKAPPPPPKAGDVVNNPPYSHWAQFVPGATVTIKEVVTLPDGSVGQAVITSKLLTKSKDKVQVETLVTTGGGQTWAAASEKTRTVTSFPAKVHYETFQSSGTSGYSVLEGKEILAVKGKQLETEWVESSTTVGDETITEKIWTAREIPGGIVKRDVIKKKGSDVAHASTELVEYKAKLEKTH
jgi:hypothetical protein